MNRESAAAEYSLATWMRLQARKTLNEVAKEYLLGLRGMEEARLLVNEKHAQERSFFEGEG